MKTSLEKAPCKGLEEEHSRAGQGIVAFVMHTPCPEIHCFVILLHILSILGNVIAAFLHIWASVFCLRKLTKMN